VVAKAAEERAAARAVAKVVAVREAVAKAAVARVKEVTGVRAEAAAAAAVRARAAAARARAAVAREAMTAAVRWLYARERRQQIEPPSPHKPLSYSDNSHSRSAADRIPPPCPPRHDDECPATIYAHTWSA